MVEETVLVFDNATIHTSRTTQEFLVQNGLKALTIAPYSPQLKTAEFFIRDHKAKVGKLLLEGR